MSQPDINHSVMLSFPDKVDMPKFKERVSSLELPVKNFMICVEKAPVFTAKDVMRNMEEKALRQKYELKKSQFLTSDNSALRELGVELTRRVLRVFLDIHSSFLRDSWIRELFFYMSGNR